MLVQLDFVGEGQCWDLNSNLCLLRQVLYTGDTPFCFCCSSNKVLVFALAGLDCNPPIYASCVSGMTGVQHTPNFFID
jgi:hypothetical protein